MSVLPNKLACICEIIITNSYFVVPFFRVRIKVHQFSNAKKNIWSRCAILGEGVAEEKEFKMFRLSLLFISVFILECFASSSNKV